MKESRELVPQPKSDFFDFERQFEPQIVTSPGRYPGYRDAYVQEGFQLLDYWRAIRKRHMARDRDSGPGNHADRDLCRP